MSKSLRKSLVLLHEKWMALADTEYSPGLTPMAILCTYNYGEWGRMSLIFWSAGLPTTGRVFPDCALAINHIAMVTACICG
jgi:hypothetical protein